MHKDCVCTVRVSYRGGGKGGNPPLAKVSPPTKFKFNTSLVVYCRCVVTISPPYSSFLYETLTVSRYIYRCSGIQCDFTVHFSVPFPGKCSWGDECRFLHTDPAEDPSVKFLGQLAPRERLVMPPLYPGPPRAAMHLRGPPGGYPAPAMRGFQPGFPPRPPHLGTYYCSQPHHSVFMAERGRTK